MVLGYIMLYILIHLIRSYAYTHVQLFIFLDLPFTAWPFGKCRSVEAAMPEAVPAKQAKLDSFVA